MSFRQSVDEQKMVRVCQEMDELVKLWEKRSAEMKSLLRSLSSVSVSPQITSKVRQQTMSDTEDLWSFELSDSRKNLPPGFQTDAESPQEATQALQRMMQNPVEIGKLPGALDEFESHLSVLNTWSDLKRKIAFVKILHPKLKNKLKEHIRPYTSYGKVVKKALNLDEHLFYYKTFSSPSLTKAKANAPATIGGFSSSLLDSTADDYDDLIRKSKTKINNTSVRNHEVVVVAVVVAVAVAAAAVEF
ncbi:hypothetical protein BGZ76_001190, partial [Entomortierella beljakovae]